jgi:divalent metal cation (Fe/Co/Zn/Cd) transporter
VAWRLTGSAGLLSDALESLVNLVAAALAVVVLHWAAKPPDDEHTTPRPSTSRPAPRARWS